jgi:hypothetical protein
MVIGAPGAAGRYQPLADEIAVDLRRGLRPERLISPSRAASAPGIVGLPGWQPSYAPEGGAQLAGRARCRGRPCDAGCEPRRRFQELRNRGRVIILFGLPTVYGATNAATRGTQSAPYSAAIRTKLGEALRERYDLREPLAPGLVELLGRLDGRVLARETAMAKLYAEVDEAVATIVRDAKSKVA